MILQSYGTTIAVAVLVGAWVASTEAKRRGLSSQLVWDALPWVLVFGLVGARAYHVLHLWDFYRQNLEQVLFVWNGGLGIYGAIAGGLIGFFVWARHPPTATQLRAGKRVKELLDIAAPGVAIGQAVGRFANYFSQELYGWPTDLPWGIYIKPENRFPGLENFEYFHPLFLYEALWCLLGFVVLTGGYKRFKRDKPRTTRGAGQGSRGVLTPLTGELFLCYISFYALGRFFLEGMRIESWMIGGARVAQLLSAGIIFGSITLAVVRRMRSKKTEFREQKSGSMSED